MKVKTLITRIFPFIFLILCFQVFTTPTSSQTFQNEQVSDNVWRLLQWNERVNLEWYPRNIFVHAKAGTNVIYNITSSENNMTNPNTGKFSIGNVSNLITSNYDLANTFSLSIYPWFPGFVTNPANWTAQKEAAKSAAAGEFLKGQLDISEGVGNASNYYRNSVHFEYLQDIGGANQNTTLTYDKDTGVLIYAYTKVFIGENYIMELELASSSLITSSNYNITPGFTLIIPLSLFVVLAIIKKRKIKLN